MNNELVNCAFAEWPWRHFYIAYFGLRWRRCWYITRWQSGSPGEVEMPWWCHWRMLMMFEACFDAVSRRRRKGYLMIPIFDIFIERGVTTAYAATQRTTDIALRFAKESYYNARMLCQQLSPYFLMNIYVDYCDTASRFSHANNAERRARCRLINIKNDIFISRWWHREFTILAKMISLRRRAWFWRSFLISLVATAHYAYLSLILQGTTLDIGHGYILEAHDSMIHSFICHARSFLLEMIDADWFIDYI